MKWQDIESAPQDGSTIIAWCNHQADRYHYDGGSLTIYGGHAEGMSHAEEGANLVVWGGAWDDSTWETEGGSMPDWWFVKGSEFEVAANPTHWMPLPEPPTELPEGNDKLMFIRCHRCGKDIQVDKDCPLDGQICPDCSNIGEWEILPF